jgi:hypothetical protein
VPNRALTDVQTNEALLGAPGSIELAAKSVITKPVRPKRRESRSIARGSLAGVWICRWPQRGNPGVPGATAILRSCRANLKHETYPAATEAVPASPNSPADSGEIAG